MASAISASSVATVVEDLVADRSIPLKICLIIVNLIHIITNWIVIVLFIQSQFQKYSVLELPVSLAFFIVGCYLIPAITNGVIYFLRWKRSSPSNRRRIEEENKQAWVCLRITLTLLGVPTIGRNIETILVARKLSKLEKEHMNPAVTAHKDNIHLPSGSRLGGGGSAYEMSVGPSTVPGGYNNRSTTGPTSMISGVSSANGFKMPDNVYQKIRRARRQYKRCEHDGALMSLVAGGAGGGPMAVALLFLYFQRMEKVNVETNTVAMVFIAIVCNIIWLSATLSQFYPARHIQSEAEFERGIRVSSFFSLFLLFVAHLIQTTLRVIILAVFANWFYGYVLIPVLFHWVVGTSLFIGYRCYMRPKTVGASVQQQARAQCSSILSAWYYGFVGIFDFVNGNEGKTRLRYLIYYAFYYAENVIMLVIWVVKFPKTQITFPVAFVAVLLGLFWVGFLLLQLHLFYFSSSPYGSSILGIFCHKSKNRAYNDEEDDQRSRHTGSRMRYSEEIRDPVFGTVVVENSQPIHQPQKARSRISGMDNASRLSNNIRPQNNQRQHHQPPSIMSSKSPPSILSNIPSHQKPGMNNKPRANVTLPPINPTPTNPKKNVKVPLRTTQDTDSSSDGEDGLPVFSPKQRVQPSYIRPASSQPDLMQYKQPPLPNPPQQQSFLETDSKINSSRTTSPPTSPSDIKGKFKANYYQPPAVLRQNPNSAAPTNKDAKKYRSLENLSSPGSSVLREEDRPRLVPITKPGKSKPIMTVPPLAKHNTGRPIHAPQPPYGANKPGKHGVPTSKTHRIK